MQEQSVLTHNSLNKTFYLRCLWTFLSFKILNLFYRITRKKIIIIILCYDSLGVCLNKLILFRVIFISNTVLKCSIGFFVNGLWLCSNRRLFFQKCCWLLINSNLNRFIINVMSNTKIIISNADGFNKDNYLKIQ